MHFEILIRIYTYFDSSSSFLEYHDILGTMVHEITHNKISKHDETFYKLMDQLYDEVENIKSYPFPGSGISLGGTRHPASSGAKTLIRNAALSRERRGVLFSGSGQKLGSGSGDIAKGNPQSIAEKRELSRLAAERRLKDSWCNHGDSLEFTDNIEDDELSSVEIQDIIISSMSDTVIGSDAILDNAANSSAISLAKRAVDSGHDITLRPLKKSNTELDSNSLICSEIRSQYNSKKIMSCSCCSPDDDTSCLTVASQYNYVEGILKPTGPVVTKGPAVMSNVIDLTYDSDGT